MILLDAGGWTPPNARFGTEISTGEGGFDASPPPVESMRRTRCASSNNRRGGDGEARQEGTAEKSERANASGVASEAGDLVRCVKRVTISILGLLMRVRV